MDVNSGVGFGASHQHGKKMAQDSVMDLSLIYTHHAYIYIYVFGYGFTCP